MSYRIFMTVSRGMTDATAVCVFPWEKPILEEIHGGNAREVKISEMLGTEGSASVRRIRLKHESDGVKPAPPLAETLENMLKVEPDRDPLNDLDGEWSRLIAKYGMHTDVNLPNVEKVYGSLVMFKSIARQFKGAKSKNIDELLGRGPEPEDEPDGDDKPIAEMTQKELREFLKSHEVEVPPRASVEDLRDLAATATA